MITWNPRANELFLKALELEPPARQVYLDEACAGDAALRAEVESLLQASDQAGSFLASPAAGLPLSPKGEQPEERGVATVDEVSAAEPSDAYQTAYGSVRGRRFEEGPVVEQPGTVIDSYKLLEPIGEGGFGVVFLAEQREPIRRQVALKVLKPGMDTRQVVARFEAERQALALMDHPNIARILDGGATASGRPYFVMELVKGAPITQFCDHNHLAPRARLELFVSVCQAVQHAHQKGIIHRDLKPSNVLVIFHDNRAVVKIIDFGIAKALGQQLTDKTLFTGFAQMIGTPLYMSPEQAGLSGLDVDTRSDVYSLGVLLYELLTGTTPFDQERLRTVGYDEMRRIIREEEPPRPSIRLSTLGEKATPISAQRGSDPRKLGQILRGELDWIVMKALEKDRNRRYESPSTFAADVQRYLHEEPVLVCPPSAWYRFRKFARRNRRVLGLAAVILTTALTLAGGIGWTLQKEAGRLLVSAEQINQALAEEARWQEQSKWPQARAALKRARAVLNSGGGTADLHRQVDEREEDLDMVERLEAIRLKRTRREESRFVDYSVIDRDYAVAFRDFGLLDVDQLDPGDAAARIRARSVAVELAATLDDWTWIRHTQLKMPAARWRPLVETASQADPDPWRNRAREAAANEDWPAMRALTRSADLKSFPPRTLYLLAVNLAEGGDLEVGVARRFLRKAHWYHPEDFWINHELGGRWHWPGAVPFAEAALSLRGQNVQLLYEIGSIYLDRKDYDSAIEVFQTILSLEPPAFDRATVHQALGTTWLEKKEYNRALVEYRQALRYKSDLLLHAEVHYSTAGTHMEKGELDAAVTEFHEAIRLKPDYAAAHNNLGLVLRRKGDHDGAIKAFREAIRHDPTMVDAHANLANALWKRKDFATALESAREAVRLRPDAGSYVILGNALNGLGRLDDAIDAYRKTISLQPDSLRAHYNLGQALRIKGSLDEAIVAFQEVVRLEPDHVLSHRILAEMLQARRSFDQSVVHYKRSIELEPKHPALRMNYGNCLSEKGDRAGAIQAYRDALDLKPEPALAARLWNNIGCRLSEQGRHHDAAEAFQQAVASDPNHEKAHNNLGTALLMIGRLDDAIKAFREAVRLKKDYANAHGNLGCSLIRRGDLGEGIAELQESIRLNPADISFHHHLGLALATRGDLDQAAAVLRLAIIRAPLDPELHCNLGRILQQQGQFARSLASFQLGHDLGARLPGWPYPSAQWLRRAEYLVEVSALLPAVLQGKVKPDGVNQRLDFALVCRYQKRFTAAASFYQEAFADRPELADKLNTGLRYNAACAAALAGCGQGKDAGKLDDKERARLRRQALTWLRADLAGWGQLLDRDPNRARAAAGVTRVLQRWLATPDFAGVRGPALARLPELERQPWQDLWDRVSRTLGKAQGKTIPQKK